MGMAASQARLLTITARLADNELRSQTINNAKMRLATQSSQASENYINALNNATYRFTNYDMLGGVVSQPLTFNALTAYSPYNTQYGLVNAAGQLLVSEAEANIFKKSGNNLDAYLKEHGLKYDTTYFDTNFKEPLVNKAYPGNLFDPNAAADGGLTLTGDMLKKFFEEYNSYENSMEVEDYNRAYNEFVKSNKEIKKFGPKIMEEYIKLYGGDNIKYDGGKYSLEGLNGNIENAKRLLKAAFTEPGALLDDLLKKGIIDKSILDNFKSIIDDINSSGGNININETITEKGETDANGVTTYDIDGQMVKVKEGIVIDPVLANFPTSKPDGGGFYTALTSQENVSLAQFIKGLRYSGDNVTRTYSCNAGPNEKNEVTFNSTYTISGDKANKYLNDLVDDVINRVIASANYDAFVNYLHENIDNYSKLADYPLPGLNKTVKQLLKDNQDNLKEYIESIFGVSDNDIIYKNVLEHLKAKTEVMMLAPNGEPLYYENRKDENGNPIQVVVELDTDALQDAETVLQFMRQEVFEPSETFETVIKEYLIDQMIEEFGTPKYAWVDENDKTANQENADAKAQWYTNLFKRMQQGYKALENGLASSKEWIEYALESGTVYMEQVDGAFAWNALDYKTCSRIIEETDDAAVARAEAEYNRAMNDIKAKDSFYDLELKNIDTEHNALQTEYDVIKGVINKNIERNFKFNQSA